MVLRWWLEPVVWRAVAFCGRLWQHCGWVQVGGCTPSGERHWSLIGQGELLRWAGAYLGRGEWVTRPRCPATGSLALQNIGANCICEYDAEAQPCHITHL